MKELECEVREIPGGCGAAIDLAGGIFASNMGELTEEIETLQNGRMKNIILNLEKLDFISSSGIGLIVQKNEELRKAGKRLWVVAPNPDIGKIFEQFSLEKIVRILPDEQQAIEEIKQASL